MDVKESLRRIFFKIGTLDDVSGKGVNKIVPNRVVIDELNTQLNQYANITKGITDVYSFPLESNTPFVEAPPLALRSEAYYYGIVVSRGTIFPLDMRPPRDVYPVFRYNPVSGITNWVMPWGEGKKQYFSFFPMNNVTRAETTLTKDILKTDSIIEVSSTGGFVNNHGRITIGTEKILYEYKDNTKFYGCTRGVEGTTIASHSVNDIVLENNVILYYSRRANEIVVTDDDFIPQNVLDYEIEVVEEHMEGIIKSVAYNILVKLAPERADTYKLDSDALYQEYKMQIAKGYYRGRQGTSVREPCFNESGVPYFTNLMF